MERIGIFGGTFNPVHCGHIRLARWLIDTAAFDRVWLTLSPENPLKESRPDATDADRRTMLEAACSNQPGISPCFIEFDMPRPSYSIATLRRLKEEFPDCRFELIIGADNWHIFDRWRSSSEIISDFGVTIYPRPGYEVSTPLPQGVRFMADAPVCDISSSEIRRAPQLYNTMLPSAVANYIESAQLYGIPKQQTIE